MNYYAKRFFGKAQSEGIVTDGLKLWLDASNPVSYPGTGTVWYDLSGNGNNGTMVNGVAYSTANGGVMSFDGVNDYVTLGNVLNMGIKDMSISFYYTATSLGGFRGIITKGDAGVANNRYQIYTNGNNLVLTLRSTSNFTTSYPILTNAKYFFTAIFDRDGFLMLYSSAVPVGIPANISAHSERDLISSFSFTIGAFSGASLYSKAEINDILVYDKVLNQEEILQNFNATKHKYGL